MLLLNVRDEFQNLLSSRRLPVRLCLTVASQKVALSGLSEHTYENGDKKNCMLTKTKMLERASRSVGPACIERSRCDRTPVPEIPESRFIVSGISGSAYTTPNNIQQHRICYCLLLSEVMHPNEDFGLTPLKSASKMRLPKSLFGRGVVPTPNPDLSCIPSNDVSCPYEHL
jgi:hypothetical protein